MKYIQIPDDSDAVIWQGEEGSSGVTREGEPGWAEFQEWLSAGNKPEPMIPADSRPIGELQISAIAAIIVAADTALQPITSQYPRSEIDSWPEQCLEARAWLQSPTASTPLLDSIAGEVSKAEMEALCLNIVGKADEYKAAVGAVIAWRRVCTAWVEVQNEREHLMGFAPQFPEVPHG